MGDFGLKNRDWKSIKLRVFFDENRFKSETGCYLFATINPLKTDSDINFSVKKSIENQFSLFFMLKNSL